MYAGRVEIWPIDWLGLGFLISAVGFFWLARRLNSPAPRPKP